MRTTNTVNTATIFGLLTCAFAVGVFSGPACAQSRDNSMSATRETEYSLGTEDICSLLFSPTGRYIAAGDTNGDVSLLDLVSRKTLWRRDSQPTEAIGRTAIAFTSDAKRLFVASTVEGVAIWRVSDGVPWRLLSDSALRLEVDLATQCDRKHFRQTVFGTTERDLVSWSASDGKVLNRIADAGRHVASVAVAGRSNLVATGLEDGNVIVYKWPKGRRVFHTRASDYCIYSVALSGDGHRLITGNDGGITCWDLNDNRKLWSANGMCLYSDGIAISPDGKKVVSAAGESQFVIRDIRDGAIVVTRRSRAKDERWTAFAFNTRGTHLATGSDQGRLVVWGLRPHLNSSKEGNSTEGVKPGRTTLGAGS